MLAIYTNFMLHAPKVVTSNQINILDKPIATKRSSLIDPWQPDNFPNGPIATSTTVLSGYYIRIFYMPVCNLNPLILNP